MPFPYLQYPNQANACRPHRLGVTHTLVSSKGFRIYQITIAPTTQRLKGERYLMSRYVNVSATVEHRTRHWNTKLEGLIIYHFAQYLKGSLCRYRYGGSALQGFQPSAEVLDPCRPFSLLVEGLDFVDGR